MPLDLHVYSNIFSDSLDADNASRRNAAIVDVERPLSAPSVPSLPAKDADWYQTMWFTSPASRNELAVVDRLDEELQDVVTRDLVEHVREITAQFETGSHLRSLGRGTEDDAQGLDHQVPETRREGGVVTSRGPGTDQDR